MKDVMPPAERSIRNVPVSPSRRKFSAIRAEEISHEPPRMAHPHEHQPRRRSFGLWAAAVVVGGILLAIIVSAFLQGATVTVVPRTAVVEVPAALEARLEAPDGALAFETMTLSEKTSKVVNASGTTEVSTQASGSITVYNTRTATAQRLIANTRFEAPDGKIYRIRNSVMVPAATKQSDGTYVPGTITTVVYADSPGPDYNRGATRFTIPGFKGDARFDTFYATTEGISGGETGLRPVVSASDKDAAVAAMKKELSDTLTANAAAQIPEGFVAVPGGLSVSYTDPTTAEAGSGKASLTTEATLTAAIIRTRDLAARIAAAAVSNYAGEPVEIADMSAITLNIASATAWTPASATLPLALSGSPTLVWQFDKEALVRALAGKSKASLESVVAEFAPAIQEAMASFRPFWKGTFPEQADRITVEVTVAAGR